MCTVLMLCSSLAMSALFVSAFLRHLDYKRSEDFLASHFSLLVVQISEADYHRSKNKRSVWWDYRLFPPITDYNRKQIEPMYSYRFCIREGGRYQRHCNTNRRTTLPGLEHIAWISMEGPRIPHHMGFHLSRLVHIVCKLLFLEKRGGICQN